MSWLLAASLLAAPPAPPVGTKVADFTLPDAATGKPWNFVESTRNAKATVVVFTAVGCPVSTAYQPLLARLAVRYTAQGAVFVAINSHDADSAKDAADDAAKAKLPFPVLKDHGTSVADKFAVERVPTAVVLDGTRTVRYAGRIDDQYAPGVHKAKATTSELADAVTAVLAGEEVKVPSAPAAGCKLTRDTKPTGRSVTYHGHVAAIIQNRCQECHRPGEAAPFPLMTYQHAKAWSGMIREVVADNVMPPWHADAEHGTFKNDRRLMPAEKETLLAWVDAGCPEGDPKLTPPAKTYATGWRLGRTPDKVLTMDKPVPVPASYMFGLAGMPYHYVYAGPRFAEDTWVQAVEVRPDYRAAIHHVIAYIIPKGTNELELAGDGFARFMLAAFVPGDEPVVFPAGMAKRIPKGARVLLEIHYTPNGKAGKDQSSVGLLLTTKPKVEAKTDCVMTERFAIPPGAASHAVVATKRFKQPVTLLALTPHMHLRGKAFRYELVSPDGAREVLLNVPRYDFNWQVAYILATPRRVPAGYALECTAWYDNSPANPANPDPAKKVTWGQQTWEEMMIGFFEYHD